MPYALDWTVDTSGENCKKGLPRSVLKNTDFQYLSTMHFRMQVRLKKNCGQRIFPACHHGHSFGHSIAQCYLPIDKSLQKNDFMEDYPGALLTGFWSLCLIYLFCICKTHTGICMQFNVNLRIFNVKMSATDPSPLPLLWEQQIWIHLTIGLVEKGFWVHKTIMCRVSCRNGLAWFSVKCDHGTFLWIRNNARTLWLNRMKTYQGVKR